MTIIFYKDKDGEIFCHEDNFFDRNPSELNEMVLEYNCDPANGGKTMHYCEVEDDSLTAYLFGKAEDAVSAKKEALQDAIDDLNDVLVSLENYTES